MSALRRGLARLERHRPAIERDEAEEQARCEVEHLIASWPLSATGEPLPLWQLRDIFGENFLVGSRLRIRKRAVRDVFDFTPLVALTRTLFEHFVAKAVSLDETEPDRLVNALKAVNVAEKLADLMERVVNSEHRLGPVTNEELERFHDATAVVLATFVPPDKLDDAARLYTELLHRDEERPMGRLHEFEHSLAAARGIEGANGTDDTGASE